MTLVLNEIVETSKTTGIIVACTHSPYLCCGWFSCWFSWILAELTYQLLHSSFWHLCLVWPGSYSRSILSLLCYLCQTLSEVPLPPDYLYCKCMPLLFLLNYRILWLSRKIIPQKNNRYLVMTWPDDRTLLPVVVLVYSLRVSHTRIQEWKTSPILL